MQAKDEIPIMQFTQNHPLKPEYSIEELDLVLSKDRKEL